MRATFPVLLFFATMLCAQPPADAPPKHATGEPDFRVGSGGLYHEFKNQLAADRKYLGKSVQFIPPVVGLKKNKNRYVLLMTAQADGHPCIYGVIHPSAEAAFADAKFDGKLEIRGVCKGVKDDPSTDAGYSLILEDCVLIKPAK